MPDTCGTGVVLIKPPAASQLWAPQHPCDTDVRMLSACPWWRGCTLPRIEASGCPSAPSEPQRGPSREEVGTVQPGGNAS